MTSGARLTLARMISEAQELARDLLSRAYNLSGDVTPLGGENLNLLVEVPSEQRYVLKIQSREHDDLSRLEMAATGHLSERLREISVPRAVPSLGGDLIVHAETSSGPISARLLEYIDGAPWYEGGGASRAILTDLGRVLATIDSALETFDHAAAHRTHRWDLSEAGQHRARISAIDSAARRAMAEGLFQRWAGARPLLARLPHSVIHGDANDENILIDGDGVVGVIDFGDALINPTICDLAIALAYAMLDASDPLDAAATIVAGYNGVRPLSDLEREVLFPLICGRLGTTVAVAADRRRIAPDHPNWFITEARAWTLIERVGTLDPAGATRRLMQDIPQARSVRPATRQDVLADRSRHVSRALSIAYREPLNIARGLGQILFDVSGRPFLDLVNNVAHVGHGHPRVVEAGQRQMARLNTNTRYLYRELNDYASRLSAMLPASLDMCFFVNSGSEANELAIRLARTHTRRRDVLVVDAAYHGNTNTLVAASPYKFKGKGGTGVAEPWVHVSPIPDGYRGTHKGSDRLAGEAWADDVRRSIDRAGAPIAAFLVESLMSCAGQVVPPPGYLSGAFQAVRDAGGVCLSDEVQCGFGRVGSRFWGFDLDAAIPDIVALGKSIGNGHPMGAVVTTREIAASFENGMEFFSTFGGNPVSCAIGLAVLDVIRDEDLQAHALTVGEYFMRGLRGLAEQHPIIGDVRGAGLFIGVELVRDRQTLEPATEAAGRIVNAMRDRGVLLSTDGPFENVLKIKPPMVLTEDDVDMALRCLDDVLAVERLRPARG
jgi:4-aminobutyrate aminotransferase-like enzyme/Ser/Thr protein kinase RdoA (MazF antagonist)